MHTTRWMSRCMPTCRLGVLKNCWQLEAIMWPSFLWFLQELPWLLPVHRSLACKDSTSIGWGSCTLTPWAQTLHQWAFFLSPNLCLFCLPKVPVQVWNLLLWTYLWDFSIPTESSRRGRGWGAGSTYTYNGKSSTGLPFLILLRF